MLTDQLKFLSFVFEEIDLSFENPPMTIRSSESNFYVLRDGLELFLTSAQMSKLKKLFEEYNYLKDITQFTLIYGKDPFGLNDYNNIIQEVIERIPE